jgi:hypothetical protein
MEALSAKAAVLGEARKAVYAARLIFDVCDQRRALHRQREGGEMGEE